MAKNKKNTSQYRLTSEERPTATNVDWPVFVPNEAGEIKVEIGKARLRYGTLVVEFKDTAGAVAIQNMIARGVLMGFGMIMIKPDVVNEMYQDVVKNEALVAEAQTKALIAGVLRLDEDGNVVPVNEGQTYDDVISLFLELDQIKQGTIESGPAGVDTLQIGTNLDISTADRITTYEESDNNEENN